jgi:signal peptidase I
MAERRNSTLREYFEALLIAGVFLGFTNTFVVKTFYIPSASMEDTLLIGDHLFVNRFIYGTRGLGALDRTMPLRDIDRGDVVIFRSPVEEGVDMVKRCVGLPGDTVEIVDKDLYLNGKWVEDGAYTKNVDPSRNERRDSFGPFVVPAGHYFCMGDNRDRSNDSRFWGPVPRGLVKGRAFLIYWSYGGETSDGRWRGLVDWVRRSARTVAGFLARTRWNRTFDLIR